MTNVETKTNTNSEDALARWRLEEIEEVRSKRGTFQRFRSSIHGYDVLTFDEVLDRARFIVEREDSEDSASE